MAYISPFNYVSGLTDVSFITPNFDESKKILDKKQKEYEDNYNSISALRNVGLFAKALNKNNQQKIDNYNNELNSYFDISKTIDYSDGKILNEISNNLTSMLEDDDILYDFNIQNKKLQIEQSIAQSVKDKNYNPESAYLHQLEIEEFKNSKDPKSIKLNNYVASVDFNKLFEDCRKNIEWDSETTYSGTGGKTENDEIIPDYALMENTYKFKSFDKFYNCAQAALTPEANAVINESARYKLKTKFVNDNDRKNIVTNYNNSLNSDILKYKTMLENYNTEINKLELEATTNNDKLKLETLKQRKIELEKVIPLYENQIINNNKIFTDDELLPLLSNLELKNRLSSFSSGYATEQYLTKMVPNIARQQLEKERKANFYMDLAAKRFQIEQSLANAKINNLNSNTAKNNENGVNDNNSTTFNNTDELNETKELNLYKQYNKIDDEIVRILNSEDFNFIIKGEVVSKNKSDVYLERINAMLLNKDLPNIEKQQLEKVKELIETKNDLYNLMKDNDNKFLESEKQRIIKENDFLIKEEKDKINSAKTIYELADITKYIYSEDEKFNQRTTIKIPGVVSKINNIAKFIYEQGQLLNGVVLEDTVNLIDDLIDRIFLADDVIKEQILKVTNSPEAAKEFYTKALEKSGVGTPAITYFNKMYNANNIEFEKRIRGKIEKSSPKSIIYNELLANYDKEKEKVYKQTEYNIKDVVNITAGSNERNNNIDLILDNIQLKDAKFRLTSSDVNNLIIYTNKKTGAKEYRINLKDKKELKFTDNNISSLEKLFKDNIVNYNSNDNSILIKSNNKYDSSIEDSRELIMEYKGNYGTITKPILYPKSIKRIINNVNIEIPLTYYIRKNKFQNNEYFTIFYKIGDTQDYTQLEATNNFQEAKDKVDNIYNKSTTQN